MSYLLHENCCCSWTAAGISICLALCAPRTVFTATLSGFWQLLLALLDLKRPRVPLK